jgi:hypothetical protein
LSRIFERLEGFLGGFVSFVLIHTRERASGCRGRQVPAWARAREARRRAGTLSSVLGAVPSRAVDRSGRSRRASPLVRRSCRGCSRGRFRRGRAPHGPVPSARECVGAARRRVASCGLERSLRAGLASEAGAAPSGSGARRSGARRAAPGWIFGTAAPSRRGLVGAAPAVVDGAAPDADGAPRSPRRWGPCRAGPAPLGCAGRGRANRGKPSAFRCPGRADQKHIASGAWRATAPDQPDSTGPPGHARPGGGAEQRVRSAARGRTGPGRPQRGLREPAAGCASAGAGASARGGGRAGALVRRRCAASKCAAEFGCPHDVPSARVRAAGDAPPAGERCARAATRCSTWRPFSATRFARIFNAASCARWARWSACTSGRDRLARRHRFAWRGRHGGIAQFAWRAGGRRLGRRARKSRRFSRASRLRRIARDARGRRRAPALPPQQSPSAPRRRGSS